MLVLSRKQLEGIQIGRDIRIKVVKVNRNQVRLGIEAPPDVLIVRDELVNDPEVDRGPIGLGVVRAQGLRPAGTRSRADMSVRPTDRAGLDDGSVTRAGPNSDRNRRARPSPMEGRAFGRSGGRWPADHRLPTVRAVLAGRFRLPRGYPR